ncbi:hypothetical protein DAETH_47960 (plasmid) [Deinococcus aetherius]|uniref:Peptidase C51 domain-containing protein n=1 Tax=Deinococcus aetherius TaxID=200252 RepID=A0ABM8AM29_9DEIO|nr:hypothetical protein [Deinococcus aetherius]BDP44827.1 hypothetical protein DAETH_47960 [Deinococcus aetherius]
MNRIQREINEVRNGRLQVEETPTYCLRVTRQVVEAANDWKGGEFFDHIDFWMYRTAENLRRAPAVPWARSVENAFIQQHMVVPVSQARAGDLVFSCVPADQGHIGVLGEGDDGRLWVLENATVRRGQHLRGALNWVPLTQWSGLTTVGRLPDAWVFDPEPKKQVVLPQAAPAPVLQNVPGTKVLIPDGKGGWQNVAGQRLELPVSGTLVINNSLDPEAVWLDIRGAQ